MEQLIKIGDPQKGYLTVVESHKNLPFEIKRVYFIYSVPRKEIRGFHAHKKLRQMLICVHGEINIILDDGLNKEEFRLSNPNYAVIVPPGVWRTMEWLKKDSVLLVLASDYYDESDYIRSYEEFTEFVKKEK